MPLKDGAVDKYGGRYEGLWTVSCLADVAAERADSIRLEPPGDEGRGVDFWIGKDDAREYHQVKRQRGSDGHLTLTVLGRQGVLTAFYEKLSYPTFRCMFVSADGAPQLSELAGKAGRAASFAEFEEDWRQSFGRLCALWGDCARTDAFERLRRVDVRTIDEATLRSHCEMRLEPLAEGDPSNVADVLDQLALKCVHKELRTFDIWRHLDKRATAAGTGPTILACWGMQSKRTTAT